eukprot:scaffold144077_cov31-Tisochrysis_lutea.AAC.7
MFASRGQRHDAVGACHLDRSRVRRDLFCGVLAHIAPVGGVALRACAAQRAEGALGRAAVRLIGAANALGGSIREALAALCPAALFAGRGCGAHPAVSTVVATRLGQTWQIAHAVAQVEVGASRGAEGAPTRFEERS